VRGGECVRAGGVRDLSVGLGGEKRAVREGRAAKREAGC
jgi:hypothetical protein